LVPTVEAGALETALKEEILSALRPFMFRDVIAKVSAMLDQYRSKIEAEKSAGDASIDDSRLLKDQVEHLLKAMTMISKVPANSDGAMMARGIAEEAISATSAIDD
jgi:hypothetical protein